ncbi:hypothetical protein D3C85_1738560 [compost metagenome]
MQTPFTVALNFIRGNGMAGRRIDKLHRQTQQAAGKQHIPGIQQHQPGTRQLSHRLIQVIHPIAVTDLNEMQRVARGGDGRWLASLEH